MNVENNYRYKQLEKELKCQQARVDSYPGLCDGLISEVEQLGIIKGQMIEIVLRSENE